MSIIRSKFTQLCCLVALLSLVACSGQTVQQDEVSGGQTDTAVVETDVEVKAAKAEPEVVEQVPAVEIMPQKQSSDSTIAVESIPAKDESPATKKVVADQETQPKEPAIIAPVQSMQAITVTDDSVDKPQAEAKAEPVPAAKAVAPVVPTSSGPNNFVVTVGAKQQGHPAYGKGHAMGFLVDGISGKELVVERGKVYTFDIATDAKHDVYLSRKAIGWGSAAYSVGVEGAYTYKGKMVFAPSKDTPNQLYYACRNHPFMGATIHVVNPGETANIKPRTAPSNDAGSAMVMPKSTVTEAKVKQKLMFAEMMAGATGTKRVMSSQNDEAKQLVTRAKQLVKDGRSKSMVGALPEALDMANQALTMLSDATRLVPGDEELAELARIYKNMLAEIQGYQKSYQHNLKSLKKKGDLASDVQYDEKKFSEILSKAESFAQQKNYVHANKLLEQAQTTMTAALHKMLDSKTLVYDLKFETAADEYDYEVKRFVGYEELIPIAIEAKKPAAGAIKLMESFLGKARKRRDEAQVKADSGDYSTAISMMLEATKTVRRALRMVGVSQ